jgi:hypothetical protein
VRSPFDYETARSVCGHERGQHGLEDERPASSRTDSDTILAAAHVPGNKCQSRTISPGLNHPGNRIVSRIVYPFTQTTWRSVWTMSTRSGGYGAAAFGSPGFATPFPVSWPASASAPDCDNGCVTIELPETWHLALQSLLLRNT